MASRPRVAVLCGGTSSERGISKVTGHAVAEALHTTGYVVREFDPAEDDYLVQMERFGTEVALIALHGAFGEDGKIQQILESKAVPYTGSGVRASRLAMDKPDAKEQFTAASVPTPNWRLVEAGCRQERLDDAARALAFPLVVKPAAEGSSLGVSLVRSPADWHGAIDLATTTGSRVLIEQYIAGRELTVAVIDGRTLPIVEMTYETDLFDFQAKYTKGITTYRVAPQLDASVEQAVRKAARGAFECLHCAGVARVDLRLSASQAPYVLEVNTIPGMTATSLVPKAARQAGIEFPELVGTMVQLGLAAHRKAKEASGGKARKASA